MRDDGNEYIWTEVCRCLYSWILSTATHCSDINFALEVSLLICVAVIR